MREWYKRTEAWDYTSPSERYGTLAELTQCTIQRFPLDDHSEYTAVSYVWGSPNRNRRILLNDAYYNVTESLEMMLRNLQDKYEPLTLWIDQICIDQDSSSEKEAQVQLMKHIYQQASRTIVWLGPAADNSDSAMEFAAQVGREVWESGLVTPLLSAPVNTFGKGEESQNFIESMGSLLEKVNLSIPLESYGKLIARPWFYRVWVVQEVSVARSVVFKCGEKDISYDQLFASYLFFNFGHGMW
jgi:hypothetical protein